MKKPLAAFLALACAAHAQDLKPIARSFPPIGDKVAPADQEAIRAELAVVEKAFSTLPPKKENANAEVFLKAVRYALDYSEFYKPEDAKSARALLAEATSRIESLRAGKAPWMEAKGAVVRGYYSPIDGSPQPFGLDIPDDAPDKKAPAWVWLQGRGETRTDLHFIAERMKKGGQFHPAGTIIVHAWGRYCVGTKNAGEQDVVNVRDLLVKEGRIDPRHVALAGFSMGGAGAWLLGAHYTDRWAVVHPGAGFVEVKEFQNLKPEVVEALPAYEKILWGQNDVPDYVRNLLNVPVVAYSGEKDGQREAAEIMTVALAKEGLTLKHLIGPNTEHKYEPEVRKEVEAEVQKALLAAPNEPPLKITFQTKTLDYSELHWLQVTGLEHHWQDSRVDATLDAVPAKATRAELTTKNVTSLRLRPDEDGATFGNLAITIDGQKLTASGSGKAILLTKTAGKWVAGAGPAAPGLRKIPGLQGPVDDAFTAPFLYVLPDKTCASPAVESWVKSEIAYQTSRWRYLMRGDLRAKKASEVTADDVKNYNLILWGDPAGNTFTGKLMAKMPFQWTKDSITVAGKSFPTAGNIPVMIYPNPLNPAKYVVLNSGLTFRENHKSNALQNPHLPDWAIVDLSVPPNGDSPGAIPAAGFFDEEWKLKP